MSIAIRAGLIPCVAVFYVKNRLEITTCIGSSSSFPFLEYALIKSTSKVAMKKYCFFTKSINPLMY